MNMWYKHEQLCNNEVLHPYFIYVTNLWCHNHPWQTMHTVLQQSSCVVWAQNDHIPEVNMWLN